MEFEHIGKVWEFLDKFHTIKEMEQAFDEIPNKFGSFEITNYSIYKEDGFIEICNSLFDENTSGYEYDYHCVPINKEDYC